MSIKGLEQAIENLNSISKTAVPRASAQAVNRVANRAVSRSVAVVSKDTRVPRKLVKQRARVKGYKIKYPNGVVDVFKGWVSSLGKTISSKEVMTRTAKITNNGKPSLAEDSGTAPIAVTGISLDKSTAAVAVAATTQLVVSVLPASASDKSFRVASSDPSKATVTVSGNTLTVTGVAAGTVEIIVMSNDGNFVAICKVTVS
ncbi:hypothetical protein D9I84_13830 [Escherichia coli]|nr:hypothetical protein [Escherichia coli]